MKSDIILSEKAFETHDGRVFGQGEGYEKLDFEIE
jgi:hypothetical protein